MKKLYSILCWLLLHFVAYSQPFSLQQVMSSPFPEDLIAAPKGVRFVWAQNQEGKRNVWVAESPNFTGKQLTNYTKDDGQEVGNFEISYDGSTVAYVRGGVANGKGENPNPTSDPEGSKQEIYLIPFAGGTPKLLSDGTGPTFSPDGKRLAFLKKGQIWASLLTPGSKPSQLLTIRGGAGSLRWSPDGSQLAFVSNRGDHSYIGIYDLTKKTLQYLNPSVDWDSNPVWSPDGKQLAFLRNPNQKQNIPFTEKREGLPWSILLHELTTNRTKEIWKAKAGAGSSFWAIAADNQLFWSADDQIVFPYEGDGWLHLYAIPASGGEPRLLTPGNFEVQYVTITPDNKTLFYSSNQDDIDRQHIWKTEIASGKTEAVTTGTGIEWLPAVAADGTLTLLASSATQPAFAAYLNKGKITPFSPVSKEFPSAQLIEPEPVIISAADGMSIHCQLFKPKNANPDEKHPALLFFHGGSRRQMYLGFHDRGYYHNAYAMNQYLASQGYIVLSVNYRSGIGYGMEFREALNYGANGASEFNDVMGAGLYLRGRSDVDAERIGLWGGSYGGYLTAMGLAKASNLFAAGVDFHGVHDWNVVIRNFAPAYNPEKNAAVAKRAFDSSPIAYVDTWRSPVLLIHADDDRNVPFSETVDIAESLRRKGIYFEQLIFPDDVHGFLLHKNWMEAYEATAAFFDKMLKNKRP